MKLLAILAVALAMLASPALAAKDILMVVLEDTAGQRSLHYQPSADCMAFLSAFMKHEREGVPTFLTFEAPPPAHGKVLVAYCILPSDETVCSKPVGNLPCKQGEF